MKAKFNGKEYRVSEIIDGGEILFEIEEMEEVKDQPEAPEQPEQPERKFKAGDKVRIKDGISSKTKGYDYPYFTDYLDEYIGEKLTVKDYISQPRGTYITMDDATCDGRHFGFAEGWLEPWSEEKEELKKGDLAIFWDDDPCYSLVRVFERKEDYCYIDECGTPWVNAVKFECTKEQKEFFNKVRKGEITL